MFGLKENCDCHALMSQNETQKNCIKDASDTWTYNHSKQDHVLNLLSISYQYD